MADTADSKSAPGNRVGVQVPPGAFQTVPERKAGRVRPWAWVAGTLLGYALVPALIEVRWQAHEGHEAVRTVVRHCFTVSTMLSFLLLATRLPFAWFGRWVCAVAFPAYATFLWLLFGYWWFTGHQFDVAYAVDAGSDVWPTLVRTLGSELVLLVAVVPLGFAANVWWWAAAFHWLARQEWKIFPSYRLMAPIALQLVTLQYAAGERQLVWPEVRALLGQATGRDLIAPIFPRWEEGRPMSRENVFILQLESGSAVATGGELVLDGRRYDGDYLRHLRAVAQDGVWFPRAWGNSVQTNRALENILCGIDNNVGQALSYTPDKMVVPCLPARLQSAGYRTWMFVGFDDLSFMNYRTFAHALGFEEVWDATLAGKATTFDWGVDDCEFYRAVFSHLRRVAPAEKWFVYVGVSSHHYPFSGRARYAALHPFPLPQNFVEWFLNSWVEQDFCVGEFYRLYRELAPEHSHLFITPDHAWPIGLHGNTLNDAGWYNENFLISLAYVPPAARREEFRVGEVSALRPGLSDLPATILDLLTGQREGNSFAHALRRHNRGEKEYEDCHLLVQPYGGGTLAVVRGDEKIVYHVHSRELYAYDLAADPLERSPRLLARGISYPEVREKYYCRRHRGSPAGSGASRGGALGQQGHKARK